ncbi:MAG: PAS domain S-box protein, partial [Pyrinomonadaceae bacterium]
MAEKASKNKNRSNPAVIEISDAMLLNPLAANGPCSDDMFRNFIENLPVMFYAVTPTTPHVPLYISPTFENFGYPLNDWLTDSDIWDRVIHPDDREKILGATRLAMQKGEGIDFEYRVICSDGNVLWVRDRGCFIEDCDGSRICWQGIIIDVTEKKLGQIELEKRQELYRTLARSIPETAVLLFDHDLKCTLAEGEQLYCHGWTPETFENKKLFELFPSENPTEWIDYYNRALGGEEIVVEKQNTGGVFLITILPVRNDAGEIFAGMVMWHDVTDQKHANDAIIESESRYRQLFENANDIVYVHDLTGTFTSINNAGERIFGYEPGEAVGMNVRQIIAPEHVNRVIRKLNAKIARGADQTVFEVECIKKDRSRVTLEINSSVITRDGVPTTIQGMARDITERKASELENIRSEKRYKNLFENANDLIYTHDLDGNFTSLNRAGEVITGYSREEAVGKNIAEIVAPDYIDLIRSIFSRIRNDESPTTFDVEIIAKGGHRVSLELSTRIIVIHGVPVGVQGIGRDITERRESEVSLHRALSLLRSTFESTADGIVVMSLDRQIVTCNKKFVEMWGIDDAIIHAKNGTALVDHIAGQLLNPDEFCRHLDSVYLQPEAVVTGILELKDGRIIERYSQPQFMDGQPIGRVASFRDITKRTRAEEKLRHYALHDTLTNLPNRVQFMNHLEQAVERASGNMHARFAVLFLDLDRFKVINDSLGHAVGDKLLIGIGERLKACVRPGHIVARLGGDEFVILLNRSGDLDEVSAVAERLQTKISDPFKLDNYEVFTTASIGIIVSGAVRRSAEDLIRDADAAMYRAKECGKARYEIFDREMHVRNMNLLQVEMDLRSAVERAEFEVFYQPIVDIMTGSVCEFEALIRWRHPVHGLVGPDEFVHVAEETGLIIPIGKWILDESCRQIAEWQRRYKIPLSVSVNLSAKQLMHPNLISQVRSILQESGIEPSQLKLEVTESTVMEHSEKSMNILSDLDQLGVALSTDDFGTGYSSLSYLQKFPFDRLKIDRSFVNIMDSDDKSGAIVKTILMLGENLDIEVVAEGIETIPQLEKLRDLGCVSGQGYLFSRPVDRETIEEFLEGGANVF